MAPKKDKIITPWAIVVSDLSGEVKYDFSTWNKVYFERLRDFMAVAADHDIVVEVTRFDAQTLNNGTLLAYQVSFVRKMVNELNEYDNFFFEIQNEPWADHPVPVYNIRPPDLSQASLSQFLKPA